MKTDLNQDAITKQAANFVARLYSGELSAEEENEIYAWCDQSPQHQQEFDNMLAIWDSSNQLFQTAAPVKKKKHRNETA